MSRQFEHSYYGYYGYPSYWGGPYMWGDYPYVERDRSKWAENSERAHGWDSHLRSTDAVTGYHLHALDGRIGHIEDFVIDDQTWAIRYLIVATTFFLPGKRVLLSPQWIEKVSWAANEVTVDLSREAIKDAPEYLDGCLPTRGQETSLHEHYHRPGYWVDDLQPV